MVIIKKTLKDREAYMLDGHITSLEKLESHPLNSALKKCEMKDCSCAGCLSGYEKSKMEEKRREDYFISLFNGLKSNYHRDMKGGTEPCIEDNNGFCEAFLLKSRSDESTSISNRLLRSLLKEEEKLGTMDHYSIIFIPDEYNCGETEECLNYIIKSSGFKVLEWEDYKNYPMIAKLYENILEHILSCYVNPTELAKRELIESGFDLIEC